MPGPHVAARYPSDMAVARQISRIKALTHGQAAEAARTTPCQPPRYVCPAAQASRSCRFITLPLALRGSGSAVRSIVSGTL